MAQLKKTRCLSTKTVRVGYLRFSKSLDLQTSSLLGHFKKIYAFLEYAICFHETVHDKWRLH